MSKSFHLNDDNFDMDATRVRTGKKARLDDEDVYLRQAQKKALRTQSQSKRAAHKAGRAAKELISAGYLLLQ